MKPRAKFPIKRQSLSEMLAESLRDRILNGELRDGDSLVQETIAEEYEVSRMPVREALRQLEVEGLVALRTHKGAIVISMKREKIIELLDLRNLLECDILSHALPNLKERDVSAAGEVLRELENTYHDNNTSKWQNLHWQFHRCLYLPATRPETLSTIELINAKTDRFVRAPLAMAGGIRAAEMEHRELLRLCAARDSSAIGYLGQHIYNATISLS
ncbi:GntR family transcriptional regulator [Mesorhizobium sp. M0815]|uniref:GntR family transcriptional regulator n=1 Tax=Mesorhizobium sp. M0815 TaxID=2957005 RepID=UPI00333AC994